MLYSVIYIYNLYYTYIYIRLYTGHFPLPSVITRMCPLSITVQPTH